MASDNRILVIDDDPDVCGVLRSFLSSRGFEVETANNGRAGLAMLLENPPDLVLLDLELPELSGLEVLRKIKSEGLQVPVITISGHPVAEKHLGPDSVQLGANDFIMKPFDLDYLEENLLAKLHALDIED